MSGANKSTLTVLKAGSLVRVNLPSFDGVLALGVVTEFQVLYYKDQPPYFMVWVDMIIDGKNRPFEPENLDIIKRNNNGFDQEFIAELLKEAA